jgi:hypothetical protein
MLAVSKGRPLLLTRACSPRLHLRGLGYCCCCGVVAGVDLVCAARRLQLLQVRLQLLSPCRRWCCW